MENDAFIIGFIKAAAGLSGPSIAKPSIPNISPQQSSSMLHVQPLTPQTAPPVYTPQRAPNTLADTNFLHRTPQGGWLYSGVGGGSELGAISSPTNTLSINAHGGAMPERELYEGPSKPREGPIYNVASPTDIDNYYNNRLKYNKGTTVTNAVDPTPGGAYFTYPKNTKIEYSRSGHVRTSNDFEKTEVPIAQLTRQQQELLSNAKNQYNQKVLDYDQGEVWLDHNMTNMPYSMLPDRSVFGDWGHHNRTTGEDAVLNPFTIPDVAKQMGPATNNINHIYNLACNAGDSDSATPKGGFNPNQTYPGFATPKSYENSFPNLNTVTMVPPGNSGPIISPDTPKDKLQEMLKHIQKLTSGERVSFPHRYDRQGGTNWVDRGEDLSTYQ